MDNLSPFLRHLRRGTRLLLRLCIASLLLSCVLVISMGEDFGNLSNDYYFGYVWTSLVFGIYLVPLALVVTGVLAIAYRRHHVPVWPTVKGELLLILFTLTGLLMLHLCFVATGP
jgi:hypothetical protein